MKQLRILMMGASLSQNGGIATLEKLMLKHAPPELDIEHVTSHDEGSLAHRLFVFGAAWTRLLWRLLLQDVDLVHIHLSNGGSVLRKAILALTAFCFRVPVIMHANGAEFHLTYAALPAWAQRLVTAIFGNCKAFIAVTHLWREYYVNEVGLSEKRVHVLANPTELPAQVPDRRSPPISHPSGTAASIAPVKFVFCGRIGQRKGAFDLLHAYAHLPESMRQRSQLILAGDGEVESGKQLAASLGIADSVSFLGWIDSLQRDALLEQANIFILPSYNEGLPLALMEAMGWGLPVITTPVSGIPDIVTTEQNGLLVPPGDIPAIAAAMQRLIEDEPLRLAFGAAARTTLAAFDIHPFYDRLLDLYQEL